MRFLAFALTLPLFAQPEKLTSTDLEAFFGGLIPATIERGDIAGAVIAVVKDGKVIFEKGYGYADVASKKPVTADATLFRPGSISKLFTWTSVMQLVEQGKIDLDRDVNEYLDFKVPAGITMRHIMTHTSGFGETARELFVKSARDMMTLKAYLEAHQPKQIFQAGKVPAYSNYATTLAGYIVERRSGEPFSTYATNHIMKPLGMNHTTFVQPLPDNLAPLMSSGYSLGSQPAKDFEFVTPYPAGSVSTSADDMTRFMMAHLNDGRLGDVQVLKPETARLMHTRQASPYGALNAMALGFYEESFNGHRIIAHGGDTMWFHSNLQLILDANTGIFISQNSAGRQTDLRGLVFHKFMDRYFPTGPLKFEPLSSAKQHAAEVAGFYMTSRRIEGGFPAVTTGLGEMAIQAGVDGSISAPAFAAANGKSKKFREVEPYVFEDEQSHDRLAFRKDDQGHWEFRMGFPAMAFQRVGFWDHQYLAYTCIGVGLAMVLLALLGWPIAAAIRWHYGERLVLSHRDGLLRRAVQVFYVIEAAFLLGWYLMSGAAERIDGLGPGLDARQHFIQLLGWIAALGIPVALYMAFRTWARPGGWWFAGVRDLALAIGLIGCTWFAWYWQLLNFSTNY